MELCQQLARQRQITAQVNTSKSKLLVSSPTCSSLCLPRLRKWHHRPPSCSGQKTGRHPWILLFLTTRIGPLPRLVNSTSKINPKSISLCSCCHHCGQATTHSPWPWCQPPLCPPLAPSPKRARGIHLKHKSDPHSPLHPNLNSPPSSSFLLHWEQH